MEKRSLSPALSLREGAPFREAIRMEDFFCNNTIMCLEY